MIAVDKLTYWDQLVDYYYDHIHWVEDAPPSINEWLYKDYNCDSSYYTDKLTFKNSKDFTIFALRFSQ